MNELLTSLCLVPRNAWVQPDWSAMRLPDGRIRRVQACLTSVYAFEGSKRVRIENWQVAKAERGVLVENYNTICQLTALLSKLVPVEPGVFVFSGVGQVGEPPNRGVFECKTCGYAGLGCAASLSTELSRLWGFDANVGLGTPFTLGWFPSDDPTAEEIARAYKGWPSDVCKPMLPAGPSPSGSSVELTGLGDDFEVIGLFVPESRERFVTPALLRQALGEDAILAKVEAADFWHWLEWEFSLDDLVPIDRPLPFRV